MRRRIRLTGRKQLARSCVTVKAFQLPGKRMLGLALADPAAFKIFPGDARISVRLYENKMVELVDFGTLKSPKTSVELKNDIFSAPSCQLRIAAADPEKQGILLGSTDTWTLEAGNEEPGKSKKGILLYKPAKIGPRAWKLDLRDHEYPIIYVDERIPNASLWARTDPVFVNAVFPAVISQIFREILAQPSAKDIDWMKDWILWAENLMPGKKIPLSGQDNEKETWTEDVIDSFCRRHHLSDSLVKHLNEGALK
jgi:hypothetical protein